MDLDFLEIGTSNFDTLLQSCKENEVGISVEPLKFYLDDLPNRPNVEKVNVAITNNRPCDSINIFYIPPDVVDKQKLPQWFKGCNKIGNYHPLHIAHHVEQHVKIETVPLVNISEFLEQKNIRTIQFLKIDTEGHDSIIMKGLYEYLKDRQDIYFPRKIQFESNEHTSIEKIDTIVKLFVSLGYTLLSRGYDTLLEYKPRNNMHSF
jgi:FkbM family methyltransferase